MKEIFDNAYLISARHSLLTPDTLGFAYRENGVVFFIRSASSDIIPLTDDSYYDGKIIRAMLDAKNDTAAVIMYGGFAYGFASGGYDMAVVNRKCRAMFGDKVSCVTRDDVLNEEHNLNDSAYLVENSFCIVFGEDIPAAIEKAVAFEYSAKIAAISSFLAGK